MFLIDTIISVKPEPNHPGADRIYFRKLPDGSLETTEPYRFRIVFEGEPLPLPPGSVAYGWSGIEDGYMVLHVTHVRPAPSKDEEVRALSVRSLIEKSPRSDRRGGYRGQHRPKVFEAGKSVPLWLPEAVWESVRKIGKRNASAGVRKILSEAPDQIDAEELEDILDRARETAGRGSSVYLPSDLLLKAKALGKGNQNEGVLLAWAHYMAKGGIKNAGAGNQNVRSSRPANP